MEFQTLLLERRSVRKYESAPTHEELVAILRNAQMAPSWKNSQTTRWYVVESQEKHEQIRLALHAITAEGRQYRFDCFYLCPKRCRIYKRGAG